MGWKGDSEATKAEGLDPGLEGQQWQVGQAEGGREVLGLAGGQGLHKEATRVSPRQLCRWLQSFRAQRRGFTASCQRDILGQLILTLFLLFFFLVWGTGTRPSSVTD